jgi:hypothetical protein
MESLVHVSTIEQLNAEPMDHDQTMNQCRHDPMNTPILKSSIIDPQITDLASSLGRP